MARSSRRGRAVAAVITGLVAGSGGVFALFAASATPAFADSSAFEIFCPGTPVGNIAINGVITTGTLSPAAPAAGQQFNLTNYSSTVVIPASIASAAAALGNSAITGTAVTKIDATGATPASIPSGNLVINSPLPSPVPAAGITLNLPSPPASVGPFTASGGAITLTVDPVISLSLVVSGSTLNLTCKPYPNNAVKDGIVQGTPPGAAASPVIATAASGGAAPAATPTTAAPAAAPSATPTTAAAATAPRSSALASTGPGPHLWLVAVVGFIVLYLGSVVLAIVERPRSLLRRMLRLAPRVPAAAGPVFTEMVEASPIVQRPVRSEPPSAKPAYPRAGGSPGLWFDGWEPQDRNKS
jgi:hypothetical protein